MDITRLFVGIVMLFPVAVMVWLLAQADTWRSAVMALHLTWEREQRQSAPNGVPFAQRQHRQAKFEELVTSRPVRLFWLHVAIATSAIAFALILAWQLNDLRWIGLGLVLPFGLAASTGSVFGWLQVKGAENKLAVISSTLYGPAPPRVKVKSLQIQEPETSV